jgi:hypothetical protein
VQKAEDDTVGTDAQSQDDFRVDRMEFSVGTGRISVRPNVGKANAVMVLT